MDTLDLYSIAYIHGITPHKGRLPHLPAELLTEIARHSPQREESRLCCTSKQWNDIAQKELYRNIDLSIPYTYGAQEVLALHSRIQSLGQSLAGSSVYRTFVQTLAIEGLRWVIAFTLFR